MPVVFVAEPEPKRNRPRKLLKMVVPRQTSETAPDYERWAWDELHVGASAIQGFGLFPRSTDELDWTNLGHRTVIVPYLGKETEVESSQLARVLRSVLCGNFDNVLLKEMPTQHGHTWVQDGAYVVLMADKEAKKQKLPTVTNLEEQLIQVAAYPEFDGRGVALLAEGDEEVCYMLREEARNLLHLPPHIFDLLARHCDDEHADRNMCRPALLSRPLPTSSSRPAHAPQRLERTQRTHRGALTTDVRCAQVHARGAVPEARRRAPIGLGAPDLQGLVLHHGQHQRAEQGAALDGAHRDAGGTDLA
jgi:hypothetical protein